MKIKQLFSGDTDNTFIQFFRYVFVGGFAFVVDYGIMTALVELCRFSRRINIILWANSFPQ